MQGARSYQPASEYSSLDDILTLAGNPTKGTRAAKYHSGKYSQKELFALPDCKWHFIYLTSRNNTDL